VLDRAHAELDAAPDRARRMAVRGDVGPALGALVDDGADLVLAVLVHPDRIGGRGDTARAHDLDAVRALPELVPRRADAGVDAVGADAGVDAVGHAAAPVHNAAGAQLVIVRLLLERPEIAVTAGHRQDLAGVEEARRAHQPVRDRLGERIVAAADVAHGRES